MNGKHKKRSLRTLHKIKTNKLVQNILVPSHIKFKQMAHQWMEIASTHTNQVISFLYNHQFNLQSYVKAYDYIEIPCKLSKLITLSQEKAWNIDSQIFYERAEIVQKELLQQHQFGMLALDIKFWINVHSTKTDKVTQGKLLNFMKNELELFQRFKSVSKQYNTMICRQEINYSTKTDIQNHIQFLSMRKQSLENKKAMMQRMKHKLCTYPSALIFNERCDNQLRFIINEHNDICQNYLHYITQLQKEKTEQKIKQRKEMQQQILKEAIEKRQHEIKNNKIAEQNEEKLKRELRQIITPSIHYKARCAGNNPISLLQTFYPQATFSKNPTSKQIVKKYLKAMLRYHTDRYVNKSIEEQITAEEIFKLLCEYKEKIESTY